MELVDPVGRVGDEELAHRPGLVAVEIDGLAPLVLIAVGEIVLREAGEDIPVRPEMVVDDVEDDPEAEPVGRVDEAPQVVGRAVEMRRREQVDAVIAPAEAARELVDRHHLDRP